MTTGLVSDIPGRMRLRLAPEQRAPGFMSAVERRLSPMDGMRGVQSRPATGSIVIEYDASRHSRQDVIEMLRQTGISLQSAPPLPGNGARGASNIAATRLVDAMAEANEAIARATGRSLDLRLLFPAALGAYGIVRMLRDGLQLSQIPAYVLLWYAFDAFWKLNYAAPQSATDYQPRPDDIG